MLPAGVNKATGLRTALQELGIAPLNVVGVGDTENDHALLKFCGTGGVFSKGDTPGGRGSYIPTSTPKSGGETSFAMGEKKHMP